MKTPLIKKEWPSDHVEKRPIEGLIPYARNARTHSDAQIAQIAASIREWGWTNPVLVAEDGTIIAGHGRVLAARQLGITEVPVMVARGWTEAQKRAYVIADNQLGLNAGWDMELLKVEMAELQGLDFNLDLIGFDDKMLAAIEATGAGIGLTDPDAVPNAPLFRVARTGDLWALGKHRLLCGDSTNADDVKKVLCGVTPHLMVTDPPYGVDFDPTWREGSEKRTYMGDKPDKESVWKDVWALFPGDVIYIWCASSKLKGLWIALEDELKFDLRQIIVWNKMRFIIGRGHYNYNHETCFYGVRKGKTAHWQGARDQPTVWDIKHLASDTGHGAQKPVECMRRPIENNSSPGQAIYEPFSGSGTTLIAAQMTGRACHAIEINPVYIDVALLRWQEFTGEEATLDGVPYFEVKESREKTSAEVA
jgi:DNA modification methylase